MTEVFCDNIINNLKILRDGRVIGDVSDNRKKLLNKKYLVCLEHKITYKLEQIEIVKLLENLRSEAGDIQTFNCVNTIIIFKKHLEQEHYKLVKYSGILKNMILDKPKLIGYQAEEDKNKKCSLEQLQEFNNDLFDLRKYKAYIINYLLLNYFVRNKDINLTITLDVPNDTKKNYLYLYKNNSIQYIRNDYATIETYGIQKHKIKDNKLYISCVKLLKNEREINLLKANKGRYVSNIGDEIRNQTYEKLGESNYFKILCNGADEAQLTEMCKIRGLNVIKFIK